jgi:hypothetical protein
MALLSPVSTRTPQNGPQWPSQPHQTLEKRAGRGIRKTEKTYPMEKVGGGVMEKIERARIYILLQTSSGSLGLR